MFCGESNEGTPHDALATNTVQDVNEKFVLAQRVLSLSFRWVSFWAILLEGVVQMTSTHTHNVTDFSLLTCTLNLLSDSAVSLNLQHTRSQSLAP